mgnify:CR=1 FL=1
MLEVRIAALLLPLAHEEDRARALVDVHDVIIRNSEGFLVAHYVLSVFWGRSEEGVPVAATDVRDARFVALGDTDGGFAQAVGP